MPDAEKPTRESPRERALAGDEVYVLLVAAPGGAFTRTLGREPVTIGRGTDCDIVIADDDVSRVHARVVPGHPPIVEDLGSRNGTYVLGRRLAAHATAALGIGSVLEIGPVTFVLQHHAPGALPNMEVLHRRAPADPSREPIVVDPSMQRLYKLLDVIAPSAISVLVLGETGVGKEIYAEAIHRRSPRAASPLLCLNCAAVPESILEGELFGHEKGAFTGANATKMGLLESAAGGTLFLDEIGEASLGTQAKLLRFLESGEVLRLGSVKPRVVDVRIVAATNRDLQAMIAEGSFRADFFFRLNGISMTLPPLRERRLEIVPLAERFLRRATDRLGKPAPPLSQAVRQRLETHAWPGNVRELRAVIERAALFAGDVLEVEHLHMEGAREARPDDLRRSSAPAVHDAQTEEERVVLDAMARAGGNQRRAAELLGIARGTLIKRLEAYGVTRPRKGPVK